MTIFNDAFSKFFKNMKYKENWVLEIFLNRIEKYWMKKKAHFMIKILKQTKFSGNIFQHNKGYTWKPHC